MPARRACHRPLEPVFCEQSSRNVHLGGDAAGRQASAAVRPRSSRTDTSWVGTAQTTKSGAPHSHQPWRLRRSPSAGSATRTSLCQLAVTLARAPSTVFNLAGVSSDRVPPHRRGRRDRPQDLALVAQHVDVGDGPATVCELTATSTSPVAGHGPGVNQARPVGVVPGGDQQRHGGVRADAVRGDQGWCDAGGDPAQSVSGQ